VDAQSPLSNEIRAALSQSQVIDLTTTGRRTGRPRRIEIFLHSDDGQLFITGMPRADRTRDWLHNVRAHPQIVLHLKQTVVADVAAEARVVTDDQERRPLIEAAARRWRRTDIEDMMRHSPLIVLAVDDATTVTEH
jgi:deazaflavin-dependent oxidoreductase (nitroreductase family)